MTTLIIAFDNNVRQALLQFCSVPDHYAFLAYVPNYGILWMAERFADSLPVTLQMRPGSFGVNVVQAVPIITIEFDARVLQQIIPLVPDDHMLLVNIDPFQLNYELVFENHLEIPSYRLMCRTTPLGNVPVIVATGYVNTLHQPTINFRMFVSSIMMRNIVLHSQEIRAPIAVIFWGGLLMICSGAYRRLLVSIQDNAALTALNGTYRCFRFSLDNNHVVGYPFDSVDWWFTYDHQRPVWASHLNNNLCFYYTLVSNSFARPQVLP